jgi:hypothetical protein
MMDVMAALPPSNGQATTEVGNEHGNKRVDDKHMGYSSMSRIVRGKHDLVL